MLSSTSGRSHYLHTGLHFITVEPSQDLPCSLIPSQLLHLAAIHSFRIYSNRGTQVGNPTTRRKMTTIILHPAKWMPAAWWSRHAELVPITNQSRSCRARKHEVKESVPSFQSQLGFELACMTVSAYWLHEWKRSGYITLLGISGARLGWRRCWMGWSLALEFVVHPPVFDKSLQVIHSFEHARKLVKGAIVVCFHLDKVLRHT